LRVRTRADLQQPDSNATSNFPAFQCSKKLGAISIYRKRRNRSPTGRSTGQRASHAVIAIENTRLLKELRQCTEDPTGTLEQQTATFQALRVICADP
jgi:two-component system, NtrC family, sensor kinase